LLVGEVVEQVLILGFTTAKVVVVVVDLLLAHFPQFPEVQH
jgi:hypothetical protein